LEYLAGVESPERVVDIATSLEGLIADLNRPKALARVIGIRTEAARRVRGCSHAQFMAGDAGVDRLLEQGRHEEALREARSQFEKTQAARETAYEGAAYDGAMAQATLGRALQMGGSAEEAVSHFEEARERSESLGATRMANLALHGKADCLTWQADSFPPPQSLHRLRRRQKRYAEALDLYAEAQKTFQKLGEPQNVAVTWHQIGSVQQDAGRFEAAEAAFQGALRIEVQPIFRHRTSGRGSPFLPPSRRGCRSAG
jgi:tetratricopeptide (TPR) repeat protein